MQLSGFYNITGEVCKLDNRIKRYHRQPENGRVLIIASVASMIDQFNIPNIKILISMGYAVDIAANFKKGNTCTPEKIKELLAKLDELQVDCYQIDFDRNVMDLQADVRAFRQLDSVMRRSAVTISGRTHYESPANYSFVHVQSPIGGAIGRVVARKNGIKTIYTAHGFHFYEGAPVKNWLLYYTAEFILSYLTDILVTINRYDYRMAVKKFHARKTVYVHGAGIDMEAFSKPGVSRKRMRKQLGIRDDEVLLVSVGELSRDKNQIDLLRAMRTLSKENYKCIICGIGPLEDRFKKYISRYRLKSAVKLLGFRTDIPDILQASDMFVFPSNFEGLSVALMEAVAMKLPVVCSRVRGNTDTVISQESYFERFQPEQLIEAVRRVRKADNHNMIHRNFKHLKKFSLVHVSREMKQVYTDIRII